MKEYISKSYSDTVTFGEQIGCLLVKGDIVALRGDLGAGKTSITKGIARSLGITDEITSPTYTIVSEYSGRIPLYHMDMYRIGGLEEFELLGVEDLLFGEGVSLIEWSERIEEYLPDDCKSITIKILDDGNRKISVEGFPL